MSIDKQPAFHQCDVLRLREFLVQKLNKAMQQHGETKRGLEMVMYSRDIRIYQEILKFIEDISPVA